MLAIEVADSRLPSDLTEKAALYAEAKMIEYWNVDAGGSCVHVLCKPQGNTYTEQSVARPGETLSPLACADAVLDISFGGRSR